MLLRLRGGGDSQDDDECPICFNDDGWLQAEALDIERGLVLVHVCGACESAHDEHMAVTGNIMVFHSRVARVRWQNAQRLSLAAWRDMRRSA